MTSAQELLAQAEKKGQPPSGFGKFFGASESERYESAAELCVQAATQFRLSRDLAGAGGALLRAAEFQERAKNEDEAGSTLVEAFKCFKSAERASDAAKALERAVGIFAARGQFRRAANFEFELGELRETEGLDLEAAMTAFETAGEWYAQDQSTALANKCFVRCADLKALQGDYLSASALYNRLVKSSMGNRLSQWSIKEYLLKQGLCELAATDAVAAQRTVHEGSREDPNFAGSREAILLQDLIDCVNEQDVEGLSNKVFEYDRFAKLDKWKTTILLKIKESIGEGSDDLL